MQGQTSRSLIKRIANFPHVKKGYKYACDVSSGKIPVSAITKMACERFLSDLNSQEQLTWPYYFDCEQAERICKFAEMLPHVKGKWARASILDRLINLEPWQCFLFMNINGWREKRRKIRRFTEAYVEIPRKNGKSVIAAVIGLYFFLCDKEPGAEIYCGATTEKQALEVFRPARRMCELRQEMRGHFHIEVYKQQLKLPDESMFQPIIGKPGDGSSPHIAILDEFHEHADSSAYDALQTGMGAREQPLLLIITTAGFNFECPCHDKHDECIQILNGTVEDERMFALIYTIDPTDDPYSIEALKKANPNYGVSVMEDYLERQMLNAKRSPANQNKYLVKHLNVWTTADSAFFNMVEWTKAADTSLKCSQFKGTKCIFAVDLATKLDLVAFVIIFIRMINNDKHYYIFSHFYLPEDTVDDVENPNFKLYQKWIRTMGTDGAPVLTMTNGAETSFKFLEEEIMDACREYTPTEVAFDIWNAQSLMQNCQERGAPCVEVPQNARALSPGMKELEAALKSGRVHHDGNPILAWNVSNVVAHEDKNSNYKPNKERKSSKIDGAVASIMGISRALTLNGMTFAEAIGQGYGVRTL